VALTERLEAYVAALRGLDTRWTGDLHTTGDRVSGTRRHDSERVARLLGEFVDDPLDEAVELWRWHNGQDPRTQQPLFCAFLFRRLTGEDVRTFRDFASLSWGATPAGSAGPDVGDALPLAWGADGEVVFVDSGAGSGRGAVFLSDDRRPGPPQRLAASVEEVVAMAHAAVVFGRWRLGDDLVLRHESDPAAAPQTAPPDGPALAERLETYVALLRRHQPHWTGDLRPGLLRAEVVDVLQAFVADPVEEVVALWAWSDGQERTTRMPMFHGFFFRRLSRGRIERFREFAAETRHIAVAEGLFWPEVGDVVPVFHSAGGESVFVDSGYGPGRGHVYTDGATHDLGPAIRLGRSLAEVVGMADAAVTAGWWRITRDLQIIDARGDG
jgi:hypothetical protein